MKRFFLFFTIFLCLGALIFLGKIIFNKKIRKKHEERFFSFRELPPNLKDLKQKNRGIVLKTTKVEIRGIDYPYNASIVEGDHSSPYYLFFRYDLLKENNDNCRVSFNTYIGVVGLDENFHAIDDYKTLDTQSMHSEDPKAFRLHDAYFVTYNDLSPSSVYSRTIRLAKLDREWNVEYITNYDQHISLIEKNWIPFVYEKNSLSLPHFIYQMNPHKILEIVDTRKNDLHHLIFPDCPPLINPTWEKRWGRFSGGTPAKIVDGQYLSFFHSFFYQKRTKTFWYVMGAYTFEPNPPFRITAISEVPLIYSDIYNTRGNPILTKKLRCIYPSGFVLEKKDGRDLLHVSCGENDSAVKILTIDKKKLLESLKPISAP
ncbi:MAG: hypothetical protein JW769_01370 [Parachlamydiales bacterium]|nr:hypothetical protein [Parachlamydiales bacterium]